MKHVLVIEAQMKQYRKPFYEALHESLHADGMQLTVAYSAPLPGELEKRDNCELHGEYGRKVKGYWIWNERLLFQPLLREIISADLVVIEHANKFILNHLLLALSLLRLKRIAYWGLGENLQTDRSRFSEWYKERTLNWVDGWFAYTAGTAEYLAMHGVPREKIVAVQNSIDTRGIRECVRGMNSGARETLRVELGIGPSAPVGIFVGMLQKVKAVDFLLRAGKRVRETIADFHLLIVGGGPDEEEVRRASAEEAWVHFVGPKFDEAKAELLGIADVFLLPGRVGLAILDCFAAGLPLIATRLPIHGPEMEYLEEGRNGMLTEHHPDAYAAAVANLLRQPQQLGLLKEGAWHASEKYSIEAMVANFRAGVLRFVGEPISPPRDAVPAKHHVQRRPAAALAAAAALGADRPIQQTPLAQRASQELECFRERKCLLTTSWDDGHPLDFRVAELLEKYGFTGTFYVPRASQRPVMPAQQVRELAGRFEIGAHTLEHARIDELPDHAAFAQLSGSRSWVEDVTGKICEVFCFPGGKFRNRQLRLVREAGFRAARTVELLSIAQPRNASGLCLIPTTIQAFPHGASAYAKNAARRLSASHLLSLPAALSSHGWVSLAREMLARSIERGGVFHLWGHSWEIEEQGQWENLESFLKSLSLSRERLQGVSNSELCVYAV